MKKGMDLATKIYTAKHKLLFGYLPVLVAIYSFSSSFSEQIRYTASKN